MKQGKCKTYTSARINLVIVVGLISILILSCSPTVQTPTSQISPVETEYVGRVIDSATGAPIENAKISLDLEGVPSVKYTDSEGVYRFELSINSTKSGTIRVDAEGYESYTRNIKISPEEATNEDIRLTPMTTPPTEAQLPKGSGLNWCDTFDDGIIDTARWISPEQSASVFEQDGVLNLRFTEGQTNIEDPWAGLEAVQTDKLISEITFTITVQEYLEAIPSGAGIDLFMKDAEPTYSLAFGPQLENPGGELTFCPNYEAFETNTGCRYPTPIPDPSAFPATFGTPLKVRVFGAGTEIGFEASGKELALETISASIENFQFFIFSNPGGALHAIVDDVCVTYVN